MAADRETIEILDEGEELKGMTMTKGWSIAVGKFKDKIIDLQLIGNVQGSTADEKVKNMEARAMAVDIIWSVLNDITGTVTNHERNKDLMRDHVGETFIDRSLETGTRG